MTGQRLVDTNAAALAAGVAPATIRSWAREQRIFAEDRDAVGRNLYPLDEVLRVEQEQRVKGRGRPRAHGAA